MPPLLIDSNHRIIFASLIFWHFFSYSDKVSYTESHEGPPETRLTVDWCHIANVGHHVNCQLPAKFSRCPQTEPHHTRGSFASHLCIAKREMVQVKSPTRHWSMPLKLLFVRTLCMEPTRDSELVKLEKQPKMEWKRFPFLKPNYIA